MTPDDWLNSENTVKRSKKPYAHFDLRTDIVAVKKSRHEKYLFLIYFFKSRHEEHFCGSCFFKSGHGQ